MDVLISAAITAVVAVGVWAISDHWQLVLLWLAGVWCGAAVAWAWCRYHYRDGIRLSKNMKWRRP